MFYGRRKGKKMHGGKIEALETVLPEINISLPGAVRKIDPKEFFLAPSSPSPPAKRVGEGRGEGGGAARTSLANSAPASPPPHPNPLPPPAKRRAGEREQGEIYLEIGFGDGEHLLHQALNNPDSGFIGCEPFINGIAALCVGIKKHGIKNIRVFPDDARLFIAALKDKSIARCWLLNSDPWPKTRHHKRRFIQKETLDELHRILKPGAELVMSSDHPDLTAWQLEKALFHGGFEWMARDAADWRNRPADMPETRYQKKNMAGAPMTFLNFRNML
jgi:tRNA (guanine-N7-)-methyltransferase